jgi:hypothetical protein
VGKVVTQLQHSGAGGLTEEIVDTNNGRIPASAAAVANRTVVEESKRMSIIDLRNTNGADITPDGGTTPASAAPLVSDFLVLANRLSVSIADGEAVRETDAPVVAHVLARAGFHRRPVRRRERAVAIERGRATFAVGEHVGDEPGRGGLEHAALYHS